MAYWVNTSLLTIIVLSFQICAAQSQASDPGIRDTCRLMPVESIWVLTPTDTVFTIEACHFTDDSLGGLQLGFRIRTSGEEWTPAVDSNVVVDTIIIDPGVGDIRGAAIRRMPSDTMNAFQYGALAFSTNLLPIGESSKVADIYLAVRDQQALPGRFTVHLDSILFPPAGAFKHTPADPNIGSGYTPHYSQNPCSVSVVKLSEICGNADGIGGIDIDDIVYLIAFIYLNGPPPEPFQAGDINCDDKIDLLDIVGLVNYEFRGGPVPCSECE